MAPGTEQDRYDAFERTVVRFILGPWAGELLETACLEEGERVLDVACCTGTMARLAAGRVGEEGEVTAIDPDAGALAYARARPAPRGARVRWVEAAAEELPFPEDSFTAAVCQQGVQFFADRVAGLREIRRVLDPGGRLIVSVWTRPTPLDRAMREALAPYAPPELRARMQRSTSLGDPGEFARLLRDAGFEGVSVETRARVLRFPPVEDFLPERLSSGPAADLVAGLTQTERDGIVRFVRATLRPHEDGDGGIVVESETNVALGHA